MFRYILVGLFILLNLQADTKDALEAFKNKEYSKAFKLYEKNAKDGDAKAQSALSYKWK